MLDCWAVKEQPPSSMHSAERYCAGPDGRSAVEAAGAYYARSEWMDVV